MAKPLTAAETLRQVYVKAYREGWAFGSDLGKDASRRRHVVDAHTHAHWRAGADAGRAAAETAAWAYEQKLKAAAELGVGQEVRDAPLR